MFYFKRDRRKELEKCHFWFAWHPVTVEETPDGDSKKIWLKTVLRSGTLFRYFNGGWIWKYKEIKNEE